LFGGSGGREFFEKTTWILGAIFILGALGLSVLKTREISQSRLSGYVSTQKKTDLFKNNEEVSREKLPFEAE
ncbi:MAG: preprotein translocase subunit SecG, partial [bacterium]